MAAASSVWIGFVSGPLMKDSQNSAEWIFKYQRRGLLKITFLTTTYLRNVGLTAARVDLPSSIITADRDK
jgi:hypothetical protein